MWTGAEPDLAILGLNSMHCRICGNQESNVKYEASENMFGLEESFEYFQCANCEALQIIKFPSDMSKYYGQNYYSYQAKQKQNSAKRLLISARNRYAVFNKGALGWLLYTIKPSTPSALALRALHNVQPSTKTRILEIGCGSGILLKALADMGFHNLLGADPFIDVDIESGDSPTIKKQFIHDLDGTWDLIMFHHSFEHMPDPRETLSSVKRLLSSTGYCVIRIPTVSSYAWKHYGIDWAQLDAPRHFFLHSCKSMELLANEVGLALVDVIYDSNDFQFWGSEQIKKGIKLNDENSYVKSPKKSIFKRDTMANFARHARELNCEKQGDQAAFYFRNI
jgi:2-polyprenyl-3-methyl-5-hydroxy-6-metoxy-1,4-benzoquinol methylase